MRPIDADELYARLMKRYLMHSMKEDRLDMAARAAIGPCMEAVNRSKTIKITTPPNDPLTIEELRGMDGADVWDSLLCQYGYVDSGCNYVRYMNEWWNPKVFENNRFYRRKPEEGTT